MIMRYIFFILLFINTVTYASGIYGKDLDDIYK